MKKMIAVMLALLILTCSLVSCDRDAEPPESDGEMQTEGNTGDEGASEESSTGSESGEDKKEPEKGTGGSNHMLNGKKIIFIGNSHTYYGKTVLEKKQTVRSQAARSNDHGYFYQICKNNGAEVSVTNWTYGNHGFTDLFDVCAANRGCNGVKHLDYLTDRTFDYVVLQYGTSAKEAAVFLEECEMAMKPFQDANPDVKFVFLVSRRAHEKNMPWLTALEDLEEKGVTVVDWGGLVDDLITGSVAVPGGSCTYNQNSFIVCKSASDGYHPNMLSGYITSLMTYCAITGESAVGQDYSFCGDPSVNSAFGFAGFIATYYIYQDATTNFDDIFASSADMQGLQTLIDTYLRDKPYSDYSAE